MSYLVVQAKHSHGRTTWHEVWSGHDPLNAEHFGCEFARLNESPTVVLWLRDRGPDLFDPKAVRTFDHQGVGRNPDEAS